MTICSVSMAMPRFRQDAARLLPVADGAARAPGPRRRPEGRRRGPKLRSEAVTPALPRSVDGRGQSLELLVVAVEPEVDGLRQGDRGQVAVRVVEPAGAVATLPA